MMSMSDYFAMGGYAAYVWPAYAVTAVVLIGLLVVTLRDLRSREAMIKTLDAVRPARARRRGRATAAGAGDSNGDEDTRP
jgi:heme exporter protein D